MDRTLFTFFDLAYDIRSFVLGMPGFEVISRDRKVRVVLSAEPEITLLYYFCISCHLFNYYMSITDRLIIGEILISPIYYYRLIEPVCIVIMTNGFYINKILVKTLIRN